MTEMTASSDNSDTRESDELRQYRLTARAWLAANLTIDVNHDLPDNPTAEDIDRLHELQARLHAAGYTGFTFPVEYGGQGLTPEHERVFYQEAERYGLPLRFFAVSINIIGATLLATASHEQKLRYLPTILCGEEVWLQFLSEPSGGSDLAGLLTSAVRDGDSFVVNGQKTWSTAAHLCDFALCPVRTSWDVPKHKGISALIIDLRTPGIDVRRIRQINGEADFCEEFLTDVTVPVTGLVGDENEGWRVVRTMLEIEHAWIGRGGSGRLKRIDDNSNIQDLVALARTNEQASDPGVRRRLVALHAAIETHKLAAARISGAIDAGKLPSGYGSLLKLGNDNLMQRRSEEALTLAGSDGVAWPSDSPSEWAHEYLTSRAASIAGGSDEILRNNISERLLGLPRESSPDRDLPFNQVPHN